eukprot:3645496-Pyramimonas_sp.AAC.1
MAALRWIVQCRRVKEYAAKLAGKLLVWQDGNRIVNGLADHSALAKALVEFMRFMHGVRGCESTLKLHPAWVPELITSTPVFTILACDEFHQVYAHIEKEHDKLLAAHEKVDRARWKRFVDSAVEKGASGAPRFARLQAIQEIIKAGSEQSPHELADREMSKWMKVWSVHDDSDISLPSDSGEWDLLPHITTDMMVEAILTFKWKTAVGPSKIQPRS